MNTFIHRLVLILFVLLTGQDKVNAQQPTDRRENNRENSLVYRARTLQEAVGPDNTAYRHKDNLVSWGDNAGPVQCFADCSGFINALIGKTYHWNENNFEQVFGHKRMYAYHYFGAISAGNHFMRINNIRDVLPGDVIALQYADRSEHEDNTGHVMLILSLPVQHEPSKLIEPNTRQFEIEVIDCSKSPHGKKDSRYTANGAEYSGLGKGMFRLYCDMGGNIVAYSWSTGNPKQGFDPYQNPVVVGRLLL